MDIKSIKEILPKNLKNKIKSFLSYIPNYYRYGQLYRKKYKFLLESEQWTKEDLKNYQFEQLKKLVKYSYNNVNYYKELFDKYNINPDIKSINDFKKIPFLTKKIIRNNTNKLISEKYSKHELNYATTGGSTGKPLELYKDPRESIYERAFIDYALSKHNINNKEWYKKAILRGEIPEEGLYQIIGNNLILSSHHIKNKNIDKYIKQLTEFNPHILHVYPSSITLLSKYIIENDIDLKLSNLKVILSSSEIFPEIQKKKVQKTFGVEICDLYGNTERTSMALGYSFDNAYVFLPQYGFNEIIDNEIISTGFNNYAMPLLRYKTEDMVVKSEKESNYFKNYFSVNRIQGRSQDFIVGKSGILFPIVSIIFGQHHIIFGKAERIKVVQNKIGKILVKIIPKDNISIKESDIKQFILNINKYSNNEFDINVELVASIDKTLSGKHKLLEQNLDINKWK